MAGRIVQVLLVNQQKMQHLSKVLPDFSKYCGGSCFHLAKNYSTASYFHATHPKPLLGLTMSQVLDRAVEKFPQHEAVVDCTLKIRKTFSEYKQDVDKLAAGFLSLNLKKGDRIGLWSTNSYQYFLTQLAAGRLGLIMVCLNALNQSRELDYCIRKTGVRVLVACEGFRHIQYYQILKELLPELEKSGDIIRDKRFPNFERIIMISEKKYPGTLGFGEVVAAGGAKELAEVEQAKKNVFIHDPANIYFTSGTTGLPSAAVLSQHSMVNMANIAAMIVGVDESEVPKKTCATSPLFHVLGGGYFAVGPAMYGHSVVIPAPLYSVQKTLEAIEQEKCNFIIGTPTMIIDLLNHPDFAKYDLSSLETAIVGGASVPPEVIRLWREKIKTDGLLPGYGMSESSAGVCLARIDDKPAVKETTVGRPMNHTEVKIVDEKGHVVPLETPGELLFRGYCSMIGYWEDIEKTRKLFTDDHWVQTGDVAKLDKDGNVTIIGRICDMINRGGENVYPSEVADFVTTHPKISEVHVFGIPDQRLGEKVCAWVLLKHGEKLSEKELKAFCINKIASYKIPEVVKFVNEFPKLGTGKVNKVLMKQEMMADLNK